MWLPSCSSIWLCTSHKSSPLPCVTVIALSVGAWSAALNASGHSVTLVNAEPISVKLHTKLRHVPCHVRRMLAAFKLSHGRNCPAAPAAAATARAAFIIIGV